MSSIQLFDQNGLERFNGTSVGGQPWTLVRFAFAYNTTNIRNGVTAYTPTVGQILYNAWIQVLVAFNGTTPKADISQFTGALAPSGLWQQASAGFDPLTAAQSIDSAGGGPAGPGLGAGSPEGSLLVQNALPAVFTTTDPLLLVLSQDGNKGGAAVGGTTGSAVLHLLLLTP
jgi:hypothetical protein